MIFLHYIFFFASLFLVIRTSTSNPAETRQPNGPSTVVYMLDTGINETHSEFQTASGSKVSTLFNSWDEVRMHSYGTAHAAIIGGNTYGVIPNVTLKDIRVFDDLAMSFISDVISGIQRAIDDHNDRGPGAKSVVSMCNGHDSIESLDDAVRRAIDAGLIVVTAPMNNGQDASLSSPCRVTGVICVGLVDENNEFLPWSGHGPVITVSGLGRYHFDTEGAEQYQKFLDASFACAHVAGVVSEYMSQNSGVTQASALSYIKNNYRAEPYTKLDQDFWDMAFPH